MKGENKTIWTIGHSTHPFNEFIQILQSFNIEVLADIRSFPGSRRFPHFNKEALEVSLPQNNIQYVLLKNLGGRRKPNPGSKNTGWRSLAFRSYADYMETIAFKKGVLQLESIALQKRTAFMCSEAVWWRCHRSMVSDYLKLKKWKVIHIMGIEKVTEHPYTPPARIVNNGLNYEKELDNN